MRRSGSQCRFFGGAFPGHTIKQTIRLLLAEGWRHVRIEVVTENRAALGLYRSCGFREIAEYRYYAMSV